MDQFSIVEGGAWRKYNDEDGLMEANNISALECLLWNQNLLAFYVGKPKSTSRLTFSDSLGLKKGNSSLPLEAHIQWVIGERLLLEEFYKPVDFEGEISHLYGKAFQSNTLQNKLSQFPVDTEVVSLWNRSNRDHHDSKESFLSTDIALEHSTILDLENIIIKEGPDFQELISSDRMEDLPVPTRPSSTSVNNVPDQVLHRRPVMKTDLSQDLQKSLFLQKVTRSLENVYSSVDKMDVDKTADDDRSFSLKFYVAFKTFQKGYLISMSALVTSSLVVYLYVL